MNLDEETERLLSLHPAVRAGAQPNYADVHWQPQHAVPRRPTVAKPTDWEIESRVLADIAAIDRELDPQAEKGDWWITIHDADLGVIDRDLWDKLHRHFGKARRLSGMYSTDARGDVVYTPTPPKQRKPKTYVAPGRKAGRTWIARLEQSKRARSGR